jgi:hypothetical protein
MARMLDHSVLKPESVEADIVAGVEVVSTMSKWLCLKPSAASSFTAASAVISLPFSFHSMQA